MTNRINKKVKKYLTNKIISLYYLDRKSLWRSRQLGLVWSGIKLFLFRKIFRIRKSPNDLAKNHISIQAGLYSISKISFILFLNHHSRWTRVVPYRKNSQRFCWKFLMLNKQFNYSVSMIFLTLFLIYSVCLIYEHKNKISKKIKKT